jgi:hypothetical protein
MQTSILSVLLALGLPGANSCSAQQQGLPRVGQTPPVATQGEEPQPAVAEKEDADEPEEMDADAPEAPEIMEVDQAESLDEPMAEIAEIQAGKSACKAHCEGSGSCNTQSSPQLGGLLRSADLAKVHAESLALGGQVVHVDENDLDGNVQKLTIQPGSTVILKTKNGKQVLLRAQSGGALQSTGNIESTPLMALSGLGYTTQAEPQKRDDRVRELEQRVRELEAQLRERDGQAGGEPQPFTLWGNQAQGEAREKAAEERAQARELHQRISAQMREQAAQVRQQADEIRRQAERYQKQAVEQQNLWRAQSQDSQPNEFYKWKTPKPPKAPRAAKAAPAAPDVFVEAAPVAPGMPAEAAPEVPPTPGVYNIAPAPSAPRTHAMRPPLPPRAGTGMGGEHVQELQSMLNDMRRQMDEMREQMQALRQELERAPQREMR